MAFGAPLRALSRVGALRGFWRLGVGVLVVGVAVHAAAGGEVFAPEAKRTWRLV